MLRLGMVFAFAWVLACSTPRPTLVGGVSDSGGDDIYWASDWETAPCPTWAPYDQVDTRDWTYRGPSGHHEVTLSTQGTTKYLDRRVTVVAESENGDDAYTSTSVYWACEADGLHLAGVRSEGWDYYYFGHELLYDPPILVGGPELVAGSTHVAYMTTLERWGGWSEDEVGRWRGYGSVVIASDGVIETGVGSLPAWTITLPRGVEDEALGVSRRAWADGYGAVTIGPTILSSVFPEG